MKVTWIRHGETIENTKGTYYGSLETEMTQKGIDSIVALKSEIIDQLTEHTVVYTSPSARAVETAKLLLKGTSHEDFIKDERLLERNMGIFEGLTYKEIEEQYKEECQAWESDWKNYVIRGGESASMQYERVMSFIRQLEAQQTQNEEQNVIVITHAGVIRMALCYMLGGCLDLFWKFRVEVSSKVETRYEECFWYLCMGEPALTHKMEQAQPGEQENALSSVQPSGPEVHSKKTILVTGGCRSGKSRFAEECLKSYEDVLYLATAKITDEEMQERVERHQKRRSTTWQTYEGFKNLAKVLRESHCNHFLLDCVTILTCNFMFEEETPFENRSLQAREEVLQNIFKEVDELIQAAKETGKELVLVTNEVGSGIVPEYALSRIYRDYIGLVNQRIAAAVDEVYEVKCGIPLRLK